MNTFIRFIGIFWGVCLLGTAQVLLSQTAGGNFSNYSSPAGGDAKPGAIAVDAYGNLYLVGSSHNGTNADLAVVKFSPDGSRLWTNLIDSPGFGNDAGVAAAVVGSNDLVVVGTVYSGAEAGRDILIIKFASDGQQLWSRRFNAPEARDEWYRDDRAIALVVDGEANVHVLGVADRSLDVIDWIVLKYDGNGNGVWTNYFRASDSWGDPVAIELDKLGNTYVAGTIPYDIQNDNYEYVVLKVGANGQGVWTNRWHDPVQLNGNAMALTLDGAGNIYVTGKAHTLKYAADGTLLWSNKFPGWKAHTAIWTAKNRLVVAGLTSDQDNALVILGLDSNGTTLWTNYYRQEFDTVWQPSTIHAGDDTVYLLADAQRVHEESGNSMNIVIMLRYTSDGHLIGNDRFSVWYPSILHANGFAVDQAGRAYIAGWGGQATGPSSIWIHRYAPLFAPSLTFHKAGSDMMLAWPALATNVVLESCSSLGAAENWQIATNVRGQVGNQFIITNQLYKTGEYYRLRTK